MTARYKHLCGAPTSWETRRYDKSGTCKRPVRNEGDLCPYHARHAQTAADRHE